MSEQRGLADQCDVGCGSAGFGRNPESIYLKFLRRSTTPPREQPRPLQTRQTKQKLLHWPLDRDTEFQVKLSQQFFIWKIQSWDCPH